MSSRFFLSATLLTTALSLPLFASAAMSQIAAITAEDRIAESAKANQYFDRLFDENVSRSPITQGYLGLKKDNDKWDDFSELRRLEDFVRTVEQLAVLQRTVRFEALDEQTQMSYRLFVAQAEHAIAGWKWRHHAYKFTQMGGMHSDAPAFLINFHQVETISDARAYVKRLRAMPAMFDELIAQARAQGEKGILPPKFVFPLLIETAREVISGVPFEDSGSPSALWADFEVKVNSLKDVNDATKQAVLAEGRAALQESVKPTYEKLIALFTEQQAQATDADGVWKLPEGREYYSHMLRTHTTTALTADEIHDLGLREVARIHAEMTAIKDKVGFRGDLAAFLKFTRDDPQFSFPTTEEGKAAYIARATKMIEAMRARLDEFFGVKPKAPLVVKTVEPFREKGSAAAFYEPPSADGTRPGAYYINTIDMRGLPIWEMETLAHHEAIPGHHMQIAIAQELEGMPKFRMYGGYNAYTEGWALYAEYFPKEFGFYQDPYQDFGRLADELLRAVRLVVDTGVHAKKWTRQQVVDYFRANTPQSDRDIFTETNRYIVWPGQACSYKVGMIQIIKLRERAKQELGAKFDLRGFHDVVLKNGALTMDLLEENVAAWIKRTKA